MLDNWYLGSGCESKPCSAPVPFFPDVHEELTKMWKAPYTAQSHLSFSFLTSLDGEAAKEYINISQVELVAVVQLCLQNPATWKNHPHFIRPG